jgi:hypothetical protein
MLSIESLAVGNRVIFMVIWIGDRREYGLDVIEDPRTTQRQVEMRARIEDDGSTIWIGGAWGLIGHPHPK